MEEISKRQLFDELLSARFETKKPLAAKSLENLQKAVRLLVDEVPETIFRYPGFAKLNGDWQEKINNGRPWLKLTYSVDLTSDLKEWLLLQLLRIAIDHSGWALLDEANWQRLNQGERIVDPTIFIHCAGHRLLVAPAGTDLPNGDHQSFSFHVKAETGRVSGYQVSLQDGSGRNSSLQMNVSHCNSQWLASPHPEEWITASLPDVLTIRSFSSRLSRAIAHVVPAAWRPIGISLVAVIVVVLSLSIFEEGKESALTNLFWLAVTAATFALMRLYRLVSPREFLLHRSRQSFLLSRGWAKEALRGDAEINVMTPDSIQYLYAGE